MRGLVGHEKKLQVRRMYVPYQKQEGVFSDLHLRM